MSSTVDDLLREIGLDAEEISRVLIKDTDYINDLVRLGHTREEAEDASLIRDLHNILALMRTHQFSAKTAARLLGQRPDRPFEFSSTEEEEEMEEEEEAAAEDPAAELEEGTTTTPYPSSSQSSSPSSSSSSSSDSPSTDEAVEAKRVRLDPDFVPSTASEDTTTTTTPPTTTTHSPATTEEEEETETEDSWQPSEETE
jgi:hypothetical protein